VIAHNLAVKPATHSLFLETPLYLFFMHIHVILPLHGFQDIQQINFERGIGAFRTLSLVSEKCFAQY